MKTKLLLIASSMAISGAALASPVPSLPDGPIYMKFDNREQIAQEGTTGYSYAPGEINWGVFVASFVNIGVVTTPHSLIENDTGSIPFFNNLVGGQITGMFYDIRRTTSTTSPFPATGGYIDFYYRDLNTLSATALASSAPGIRYDLDKATGFTDGTLLAHLAFGPGITSDPNVFINGSVVPTITPNFNGFAFSYADVDRSVMGVWSEKLDTDWFTTPFGDRDFSFQNSYLTLNDWDNCPSPTSNNCVVGARSTDPATAFAVPEPDSIALLGLGLLAAGIARRRRA